MMKLEKLDFKINHADSIAATVALVSWAMLFTTLFMAYTVLRMTANQWPPLGMKNLPTVIPFVSTLVILGSSYTLEMFKRNFLFQDIQKAAQYLGATIFLGLAFLVSQLVLWNKLHLQGIFAGTNSMSSLLYAFTWIHAAHIVLGLLGIFTLAFGLRKFEIADAYSPSSSIRNGFFKQIFYTTRFWHFLGIVWLLMFIMFFII